MVVLTGRYTGTGTPNGAEQLYEKHGLTGPKMAEAALELIG